MNSTSNLPGIEEMLSHHVDEISRNFDFKSAARRFRRDGYLKVPEIVSGELKALVATETRRILDSRGIRRDIQIKETENTFRKLTNVGQKRIKEASALIPAIYDSEALKGFLGRIAEDEIVSCPWEEEQYIMARQNTPGDSHGWHWGDYPYTLIWMIAAPPVEIGGMLQCIPHTTWNKEDPQVNRHLIENNISTYHHEAGDIYFLKSDTTLHRTVPLSEESERIILNTCWSSGTQDYSHVQHETMLSAFCD